MRAPTSRSGLPSPLTSLLAPNDSPKCVSGGDTGLGSVPATASGVVVPTTLTLTGTAASSSNREPPLKNLGTHARWLNAWLAAGAITDAVAGSNGVALTSSADG